MLALLTAYLMVKLGSRFPKENLFVLAQVIKKQLKDAVQKSQKVFQADYLWFGKAFKDKYPKDFKEIEEWNSIYPEVPVSVNVKVKISRFGTAE